MKCCYRKLKKYKYQLDKTFEYSTGIIGFDINTEFIKLNNEGNLTISKHYAWDGASGPTIDTFNSIRASLVHDVLYQLLRLSKLPQDQVIVSDNLFREILIKDGMSKVRAWYWHKGLRLANGIAAKPSTQVKHKIICAP